mmetsp:Transcript_11825/g.24822  ORF Transcript_11825/g.24822 Transcript_11825/m.24822 type:complete len:277 (+) Transcript_11825:65-895(+)
MEAPAGPLALGANPEEHVNNTPGPSGANPASAKKNKTSLDSFVERVKHYPGDQQVRLQVQIKVPGAWWNNMTPADRCKTFTGIAVEYNSKHPIKTRNAWTTEPHIRFQCAEDMADEPDHPGWWMSLRQWNRLRHDTFKNCRDKEVPYIVKEGEVSVPDASPGSVSTQSASTPLKPFVYRFFRLLKSDRHQITSGANAGKTQKAEWYECAIPNCPLVGKRAFSAKIVGGSTGTLFKHLATHHETENLQAKLNSKNSKVSFYAISILYGLVFVGSELF